MIQVDNHRLRFGTASADSGTYPGDGSAFQPEAVVEALERLESLEVVQAERTDCC
jgi:hypothetical protein